MNAPQIPDVDTVPVALIGMGRMGQALDLLAASRGCRVVARLDARDTAGGITRESLAGAVVAIDFTVPDAAIANAAAALAAECPIVIGTTGWSERLGELEALVQQHGIPALWSPNFSLGMQLFLAFAEDAARRLRGAPAFDVHVVETHHRAKRDAPSGTAIAVAGRVREGLGREVPITSVRVGSVPGTHEIIADGAFEQIRLVHEARDRGVFADGALVAATWLARRPAGVPARVYGMQDVIADA